MFMTFTLTFLFEVGQILQPIAAAAEGILVQGACGTRVSKQLIRMTNPPLLCVYFPAQILQVFWI